jgi:hypothetical protein
VRQCDRHHKVSTSPGPAASMLSLGPFAAGPSKGPKRQGLGSARCRAGGSKLGRLQQGAAGSLADLRAAVRLHRAPATLRGVRLPAHHLPDFHHGRPDGAAPPAGGGGAALRVSGRPPCAAASITDAGVAPRRRANARKACGMSAFGGKAEAFCSLRVLPVMTHMYGPAVRSKKISTS